MRDFIIRQIQNVKGDDLFRAKMAFTGCTPEQMNQEYGQSGKTRTQIIEEYQAWIDKCDAAIAWVKKVKE